jgi:hypothetical protein
MTPAELSERRGVVLKLVKAGTYAFEAAQIEGIFLIAEQLAEFNAKLEPDAIFEAFKKVGDKIEKMPPEQHRRNL